MQIDRVTSEYLRGIAITFVVLGHILGGTFGIIDSHITSILGIGGVTIFLLLSGYGLYQSYRKNGLEFKPYWSRKIEKVFLPYSIITVLYYLYMMVCGRAPGYPALLSNILCVDYSRTMDGTMWYMSFLLLWYLSFFLVFYFPGPMIAKIGMLFLLGFAFQDYWLSDFFGQCAWQFATNALAFPCGVGLGYLMDVFNRSPVSDKCRMRIRRILLAGALLGSAVVLILGMTRAVQIAYWKCGIALFFILWALLKPIRKECKVLGWIGKNSFLIYLAEGKLIAIWGAFGILNENLWLYLLSYGAAIYAIVQVFRLGSAFLGQFDDFFVKKSAGNEN